MNRNRLLCNSIAFCVQIDSKSKCCLVMVCRPIFIPVQCLFGFFFVIFSLVILLIFTFFSFGRICGTWKLIRILNEKMCVCVRESMQMKKFNGNGSFFVWYACKCGKFQTQPLLLLFIKIPIFNNLSQPNVIKICEYFSGRVHGINFRAKYQFEMGIRRILNSAVCSMKTTTKTMWEKNLKTSIQIIKAIKEIHWHCNIKSIALRTTKKAYLYTHFANWHNWWYDATRAFGWCILCLKCKQTHRKNRSAFPKC